MNHIKQIVAKEYGLTIDQLDSKSRKKEIVEARYMCFKLIKVIYPNMSLSKIGAEIGNKDHATVLYGIRNMDLYIYMEIEFKGKYMAILKEVERNKDMSKSDIEYLESVFFGK